MFNVDLQSFFLTYQWALIAAVSGGLLLAFCLQGWRVYQLKKQVQRLQHDYTITHESLLNIGQQLLSLEKQWISSNDGASQFSSKSQKKPNLTVVNSEISNSTSTDALSSQEFSRHDNARHLLAKGVDIAQIAKMTGLSHSEVSLINALRKKQSLNI